MEQARRPVGLGVLAIASIALALYNLQAVVMLVLLVSGRLNIPDAPELVAAYNALPEWSRWFLLAAAVAKLVLLVAAAVAYFRCHRSGRPLGTGYGVVSLVESAVVVASFGFRGDSLIGALFAIYTILAVNTMYKTVLTR